MEKEEAAPGAALLKLQEYHGRIPLPEIVDEMTAQRRKSRALWVEAFVVVLDNGERQCSVHQLWGTPVSQQCLPGLHRAKP